jgi:hypothetical protein
MAELERLGDSDGWGETLIFLLRHAGWTVAVRPGLGGGRLVIATRRGVEIRHQADRLAAAAYPVFRAALRSRRLVRVR